MDVIKYKYFFIGFSAVITALAVISMLVFGFKQGIDFAGGTLWQIELADQQVLTPVLNEFLSDKNLENLSVRESGQSGEFVIRMKEINEEKHQELLSLL